MTNQSPYLPQYTLDQLSERVCQTLPYFNNFLTTAKMWEGIPELCQRIEEEPRAVNSVIVEAKLQNKPLTTNPIVRTYHMIITRVYILLYYRHSQDNVYEMVVFPELAKAMEHYAGDVLSKSIQPKVCRIIELDQIVEKALQEQKKEVKPVFKYVSHSGIECDHLCIEYNEEKLFRTMYKHIEEFSGKFGTNLDVANVWYNAKQVVHTLRDIKRPELMIERAVPALVPGQIFNGYEGAQIILLAVYMMVLVSEHHGHFDAFLGKMESYAFNRDTNLRVLSDVLSIKKQLDEQDPFDDYDYIGDVPVKAETFSREEMEAALSEYKEKIHVLEAEKNELKQKISTEESTEQDNIEWHDKVRLELLLRLMKKDEVNLEKHGNKTKVAQVMRTVTGLPLQTCKNYCSSPKLNTTEHQEEILKINTLLQALGMNIRL